MSARTDRRPWAAVLLSEPRVVTSGSLCAGDCVLLSRRVALLLGARTSCPLFCSRQRARCPRSQGCSRRASYLGRQPSSHGVAPAAYVAHAWSTAQAAAPAAAADACAALHP